MTLGGRPRAIRSILERNNDYDIRYSNAERMAISDDGRSDRMLEPQAGPNDCPRGRWSVLGRIESLRTVAN
jgi:hypothetical protein